METEIKKKGRPVGSKTGQMAQFQVRGTPELLEWLKSEAEKNNRPIATFTRELLEHCMKQSRKTKS